MMLAILQHSYLSADMTQIPGVVQSLFWAATNLAPIAFVAIAGAAWTCYLNSQADWSRGYLKIALRAMFLLTAGHLLVNLSCYPYAVERHLLSPGATSMFESIVVGSPITDTIALCLLIVPPLTLRLDPLWRCVLVIALLALPIADNIVWTPGAGSYALVREFLFGIPGDLRPSGELKLFWWPIIPWVGVFLSGSFLGNALTRPGYEVVGARELSIRLLKAAMPLLVSGIVLTLAYKALKMGLSGQWSADVFQAMYPNRLTALFPAYMAMIVLAMSGVIYALHVQPCCDRALWFLSIMGRVSLFAYVLQFAVVESLPAVLGLAGRLQPLDVVVLFFGGAVLVTYLCYFFGRMRGKIVANDYLLWKSRCVAIPADAAARSQTAAHYQAALRP